MVSDHTRGVSDALRESNHHHNKERLGEWILEVIESVCFMPHRKLIKKLDLQGGVEVYLTGLKTTSEKEKSSGKPFRPRQEKYVVSFRARCWDYSTI